MHAACMSVKKLKNLLVCDIHVTYMLHTCITSIVRIKLETRK